MSGDSVTEMLMIEVISLFVVCGCFVAVNTHPKPDSDEEKCLWNNQEFIRSSFERTCSQQLLVEVKDVVDGTHDRVIDVDNASKVLQQELNDMREALASSTSTLVRRQNSFQKTVVEKVIASISRLLQQMSETQEKSANELEHHIYQTFENFTEKVTETTNGLRDRMAEVEEAQERSTSNIVYHFDEVTQHLQHASSEQLLIQVKQIVDNISAAMQAMPTQSPPESSPTCAEVDEKQLLVSALTGKFVLPLL